MEAIAKDTTGVRAFNGRREPLEVLRLSQLGLGIERVAACILDR